MNNQSNSSTSLLGLFRSETRSDLLCEFFFNQHEEFYARQLEKLLHFSVGNIKRELTKIESTGLIQSRRLGNLVLYKINTDSALYPAFYHLMIQTRGFQHLLKPILDQLPEVIVAFIYGSYAQGKFDQDSDIDLLVLVRDKANVYETIQKQVRDVETTFKREINIDYFNQSEFARRKSTDDPYITDILKGDKIIIKGAESDL